MCWVMSEFVPTDTVILFNLSKYPLLLKLEYSLICEATVHLSLRE